MTNRHCHTATTECKPSCPAYVEEKHPHTLAAEKFREISVNPKVSDEERKQARLYLLVVTGIAELATQITRSSDLCYLNACDLIEEFIHDPLQEQS